MYSVSSTFNQNVVDSTKKKVGLLFSTETTQGRFHYFSSSENDFTDDGFTIVDSMSSNDNINIGDAISKTLTCKLINKDDQLKALNIDSYNVYIGCEVNKELGAGDICVKTFYNEVFYFDKNNVYVDTNPEGEEEEETIYSNVRGFDIVAIFVETEEPTDGVVAKWMHVVFDDGYVGKLSYSGGNWTMTDYSGFSPFLINKLKSVKAVGRFEKPSGGVQRIYWQETSASFRVGGLNRHHRFTYELCPMGAFTFNIVNRRDDIWECEAFDNMVKLDKPLPDTYIGKNFGTNFSILLHNMYQSIGVDWVYDPLLATSVYPIRFTQGTTWRDMVMFIAGAIGKNAHINRDGLIEFYFPNTTSVETIGRDRVVSATKVVGDKLVQRPSCVSNSTTDGATYVYGTDTSNPYQILGNPLIQGNNLSLQYNAFKNYDEYYQTEVSLINANPALDSADIVTIDIDSRDKTILADDMGNAYTNENGDILYLPSDTEKIPIISQTITFNGVCSADYSAKGDIKRESASNSSVTQYVADVAVSMTTNNPNITANSIKGSSYIADTSQPTASQGLKIDFNSSEINGKYLGVKEGGSTEKAIGNFCGCDFTMKSTATSSLSFTFGNNTIVLDATGLTVSTTSGGTTTTTKYTSSGIQ